MTNAIPGRGQVVIGALLALLVSLTLATRAEAKTYYTCVAKKSGAIRFVGSKTKCRKSETKISFNSTGQNGKNGANGATGAPGATGATGAPGAAGTALGYAKVTATGEVVAGSARNVKTANVTKVGTAGYCFAGMPFTPGAAAANVAFAGTPTDSFAQVELASADPTFLLDTGCPAGSQAFVFTVSGAVAAPEPFYVLFS